MFKKLSQKKLFRYFNELKINNNGLFPFVDNYLSDTRRTQTVIDYLLFIKCNLEDYQRKYKNGELSFQDYLNNLYPPDQKVYLYQFINNKDKF